MLKNATYATKFEMLKDFIPFIVIGIKKDLKNEHLKENKAFLRTYFENTSLQRLTNEDLIKGYSEALGKEGEGFGEFISTRWVLKNGDMYHFFESCLRVLDPNFSDLEILELDKSQELQKKASAEFGHIRTYIFSVLNSVVYPKEVFDELDKLAHEEMGNIDKTEKQEVEERTIKALEAKHEREIRRLKDKCEKKLSGLQKKYCVDVEKLKKQIRSLQDNG